MRLRVVIQSILGGTLAMVLPWAVQAASVDISETCPVVIDDHTEDWATLPSLYQDDAEDVGGTDYYWTGSAWTTVEPDSYDYTTNVDAMADFQTLKLCNDASHLYLYIDTFAPIFAVHDLINDVYEEPRFFSDEDAPKSLPQTFDSWFVLSIQKAFSSHMYFYAVHIIEEAGDDSMGTHDPEMMGLYSDADDNGQFDPNVDTLLAEFSNDGPELDKRDHCLVDGVWVCGEHFDVDGGIEVKVEMLNKYGLGLFTQTEIGYGDLVTMQASIIPGGRFLSAGGNAIQRSPKFVYTIARAGVQGVRVPDAKLSRTRMNVRWDKVPFAKYAVQVLDEEGNVVRSKNGLTDIRTSFKNLSAGTNYKVRVQAKIAGIATPWSNKVNFTTAE